jgi:hypothetical protein
MEMGSSHAKESALADALAQTGARGHLVEALEALPDGLAVFDPQDRLLSINGPSACVNRRPHDDRYSIVSGQNSGMTRTVVTPTMMFIDRPILRKSAKR